MWLTEKFDSQIVTFDVHCAAKSKFEVHNSQ